jgi:hypothetical protein
MDGSDSREFPAPFRQMKDEEWDRVEGSNRFREVLNALPLGQPPETRTWRAYEYDP